MSATNNSKQSIGSNSLIFPNPVLVVGTYDRAGKANATTLAWGGIASGRDVDKFAATGLTPQPAQYVDAPIIVEFPSNMECKVTQHIDLGAHVLFIAEVKDVKIDEQFATGGNNGRPSWEGANLLSFDAMARTYRAPGDTVAKAFDVGKQFL
jgi:flavin reductase (DIM6/NTAB) family NADH-FMN oxidoreductase RutF